MHMLEKNIEIVLVRPDMTEGISQTYCQGLIIDGEWSQVGEVMPILIDHFKSTAMVNPSSDGFAAQPGDLIKVNGIVIDRFKPDDLIRLNNDEIARINEKFITEISRSLH